MANVVLKFNTDGENGFNLDDGDIVKLNSLSQSTPDASGINYGCISNTGSVGFVDYNGNIANMIDDGTLPSSNTNVDLFFNGSKVQSHITTDSSYDENSKTLNLSLSNTIKDLSTRLFSGYNYPNETKSAYDLLYAVINEWFGRELDEYNEFVPMLSDTIFYNGMSRYTSINKYLSYIKIKYPVIEPNQTFESVINQICSLAQIQLYIDNEGNFKFISGRPVASVDKIIHIPLRNICSDFSKDVFVKNKYDNVELQEVLVSDITEANELCYSWNSQEHKNEYTISKDEDIKADYYANVGLGTAPEDAYRYSNVTLTYYEFDVTFDKESNNNLNEIKDVYDGVNYNGEPYISYSVDYLHETGKMKFNYKTGTDYASMFSPEYTKSESGSGSLATYGDIKISYVNNAYGSLVSSVTDSTNLKTVEVKFNGKYSATIKVLVGYTRGVGVLLRNTNTGAYYFVGNSDYAIAERYTPLEVTVNFYGIKRKISFSQTSLRTSLNDSYSTSIKLQGNNLLQTQTMLGSSKVSDIISNSILTDYANGVKTARVSVIPVDYYDLNGKKVIDGNIGELIKVSDVVEVEGQKNKNGELIKWRVTGSDFKYDGEPLQELELMEIISMKDNRLYYSLAPTGLAYFVQADNTEISGTLTLGGQYDDGEHGLMDVIAIPEQGFASCKNITKVILNETIRTLFTRSFAYSGVTTAIFNTAPESGTGDLAFDTCENLTKVYLLGGLYGIGARAFISCVNLKEVYIGKSLNHISEYAFSGCTSLTDVYYEGSEEDWNKIYYKSNTGNSMLYNATFHFNHKVDINELI
jgi:hypothetical protein